MVIWIWVAIAIVAAIGEVMSTGLFLGSLSVAAALTAVASAFLPGPLPVLVFAALSLVGIMVIRPIAVHALGLDTTVPPSGRVTQLHVAGKQGTVTRTVDDTGGQIRIGTGEFWSARPFEPGTTLATGTRIEVVLVDGVTALVTPISVELSPPQTTLQMSERVSQ